MLICTVKVGHCLASEICVLLISIFCFPCSNRRKTPGFPGHKRVLEVNLPESSRKFITCMRKYLLFYLRLLEETKDIPLLDRAFVSLRADKRVIHTLLPQI